MDVPADRIPLFVTSYGFAMEAYNQFLDSKEIPFNYHDECFSLIPFLNDEQVKALHCILVDLTKSK